MRVSENNTTTFDPEDAEVVGSTNGVVDVDDSPGKRVIFVVVEIRRYAIVIHYSEDDVGVPAWEITVYDSIRLAGQVIEREYPDSPKISTPPLLRVPHRHVVLVCAVLPMFMNIERVQQPRVGVCLTNERSHLCGRASVASV